MRDTTALQTHTITSYLLPICHFEQSENLSLIWKSSALLA